MAMAGAVSAQTPQTPTSTGQATVLTAANSKIDVSSTPYRVTWQNGQGMLIREAFGPQPEAKWNLVFLHADAGPKGYSRYLNWFLARGTNDYALLWCYMNQTGKEFWCWMYQYPSNQLTTVRFTGSYEFVPPAEPVPSIANDTLSFTVGTRYVGPDFKFLDWTRSLATLRSVNLKAVASPDKPATGTEPVLKTLPLLTGSPLHELRVPAANGWRADGWRELHAMLYDAAKDPYYVIVYSNSTVGYVIDLKRAQTYTADFGGKITFGGDETSFVRPVEPPRDLLETRVQKYEPFEATMVSSAKHDNPYTDVILEADLRSPDGKRMTLPGYWDGNGTWRIRFAPTRVGTWSWRTRSNDPELHAQEGEIECIAEEESRGGYFTADSSSAYRRHFIVSDRAHFLPVMIADAVHYNKWEHLKILPAVLLIALEIQTEQEPPTYVAFQKRVDALAEAGFNRTFGGYVVDPDDFEKGMQSNEGGKPFLDNDLDHLNPAYFRAMDKRISYCNNKGIVPDIGMGAFRALSAKYDEAQLRTLWRYLLARYSAYNVAWNLFAPEKTPYTTEEESKIELFGGMTQLYDPAGHPVTAPIAYQGKMAMEPAKSAIDASQSADDSGKRTKSTPAVTPSVVPFASGKWLDVITLVTSSPSAIWEAWRYDKPVIVINNDTAQLDDAALRHRIWEIFLRGGVAVSGTQPTAESQLKEPEIVANAAKFFAQTRYWRLEPRPELLGGPLEDETQRRRRKRLEQDNAQSGKKTVSPPPMKADAPIYLLADRAREYVVYFSKGGSVLLDLMEATGKIQMRWYNPRTGKFNTEETIMGGEYKTFTTPDSDDWLLQLTRR